MTTATRNTRGKAAKEIFDYLELQERKLSAGQEMAPPEVFDELSSKMIEASNRFKGIAKKIREQKPAIKPKDELMQVFSNISDDKATEMIKILKNIAGGPPVVKPRAMRMATPHGEVKTTKIEHNTNGTSFVQNEKGTWQRINTKTGKFLPGKPYETNPMEKSA